VVVVVDGVRLSAARLGKSTAHHVADQIIFEPVVVIEIFVLDAEPSRSGRPKQE